MIWGRPPNLVLGAFTAVFNVFVLVAATQGVVIDPGITAAVNIAAAAVITLIAYQPPTLMPGDTFRTATAPGEPNYVSIVADPPAPSKPVEIANPDAAEPKP